MVLPRTNSSRDIVRHDTILTYRATSLGYAPHATEPSICTSTSMKRWQQRARGHAHRCPNAVAGHLLCIASSGEESISRHSRWGLANSGLRSTADYTGAGSTGNSFCPDPLFAGFVLPLCLAKDRAGAAVSVSGSI